MTALVGSEPGGVRFPSATTLIDVHHHILPAEYVAAVGAVTIGSQGSSGRLPSWSEAGALELMDAAGIAAAVTSVSSPGLATLDGPEAARLARRCNEIAAEMVERHPTRFGMFATVPMHTQEAARAEVRYAFDTLGADDERPADTLRDHWPPATCGVRGDALGSSAHRAAPRGLHEQR